MAIYKANLSVDMYGDKVDVERFLCVLTTRKFRPVFNEFDDFVGLIEVED